MMCARAVSNRSHPPNMIQILRRSSQTWMDESSLKDMRTCKTAVRDVIRFVRYYVKRTVELADPMWHFPLIFLLLPQYSSSISNAAMPRPLSQRLSSEDAQGAISLALYCRKRRGGCRGLVLYYQVRCTPTRALWVRKFHLQPSDDRLTVLTVLQCDV